jgi:hypothetical protein
MFTFKHFNSNKVKNNRLNNHPIHLIPPPPPQTQQHVKIYNQRFLNIYLGRGGVGWVIQLYNAKISPLCFFYFYKNKMYCYVIKEINRNNVSLYFLQSYEINHFY